MCFLIPALVGLISALLGYLLGKMITKGNDLDLKSKLNQCESIKENLNSKLYLLKQELNELKNSKNKTENIDTNDKLDFISSDVKSEKKEKKDKVDKKKRTETKKSEEKKSTFDAALALAQLGQKVKVDDLKIVEGIGPKIEELYHNAGIKTWKKLSETSVEKSQSILDAAGSRYAMHNPDTWAKQALLAYEGKWKELKTYQDSLNAGRA